MNKMSNHSMQRFGFTLVEVLIAVVLTLVLLGLMIRAFSISGGEVSKGRAILETAGQLRATSELLRKDLAGMTVTMTPNSLGTVNGYFEYIEGTFRDDTVHVESIGPDDARGTADDVIDISGAFGDVDDILMFTARSEDTPFRGRFRGQTIESNYAEIIWWTVLNDVNGDGEFTSKDNVTLHRRVLLIRPDINPADTGLTNFGEFQQFNDLSIRLESGAIRSNGLHDLANRANRFARVQSDDAGVTWFVRPFPHEPNYAAFQGSETFVISKTTLLGNPNNSAGEDIMLKSIAAFDVKAFDPEVEVQQSNDGRVALLPSDNGYGINTAIVGHGGYVDLNYGLGNGLFTGVPSLPVPNDTTILWTNSAYCTWSNHYESNGIDDDGDTIADEGTNGLDDDGANGPDDINERETRPPYPYPLRGIQVTIRIIEPTNKIVRQTSVITNFVPE